LPENCEGNVLVTTEVQPAAKPKRKRKLTLMQRKLAKAAAQTGNISEAGRLAGYSHATAAHRAMKAIEPKLVGIMEKHGLTDTFLVEKCLRPGLEAMETKFFAHEGEVVTERDVVAWEPRKAFLDMAFKLKGAYPKNGNSDHVAPIGVAVHLVIADGRRKEAVVGAVAHLRGSDESVSLVDEVDENP